MSVFRLDKSGSVSRVEKTPQGGLRVDAALTKGDAVFSYTFGDKTVREFRPAEEVSRADSLATLRDAPVTNEHPPGKVHAKNFRKYSVGHFSGDARYDAETNLAVGQLVLQADDMLSDIQAGKREVSLGYDCRIDEVSGVTPSGEAYDRIQRDITYNHVAIVPRGRAGRDVALRLDADGDEVLPVDPTPEEKLAAVTEQISDLKKQLGEQQEWRRKNQMETTARIAELEALKASLEGKLKEATGRADAAEGKLVVAESTAKEQKTRADAAEGKLSALESQARLDSVVTEARKVLGSEFKTDGLDELAVKTAAVAKAFPALDLQGKGLDFVNPVFAAATAKPAAATETKKDAISEQKFAELRQLSRARPAAPESTAEKAAAKLRQDSSEAWKLPLAHTK